MNKTVFFNKFRRLFGFVLTISLLGNVFAASAQNARISIKMENVPISQVIKEIENQTRYLFINKGVDTKNKVSINAVQKTIQDVLAQLFAGTEIAYRIDESYIILTKKNDAGNPVSVTGKIRDANGNPIVGASVLIQGTTVGVSSDADGAFAYKVLVDAGIRQRDQHTIAALSTLDTRLFANTRQPLIATGRCVASPASGLAFPSDRVDIRAAAKQPPK